MYESQYSEAVLASMQSAYGKGFLSPGGAREVADIVNGIPLQGWEVLDLGCGIGGASVMLAREFGAGRVLGIDLEPSSIEQATRFVAEAGLGDRVTVKLAAPGPLPVSDASFDLVFSKDVICHVPDKPAFFSEVFRVLRPGGLFASGDWIKGAEGPGSEAFRVWAGFLRESGLIFHFEEGEAYRGAFEAAGFEAIELRDHSDWSRAEAQRQLDHIVGPARDSLRQNLGEEKLAARERQTRARIEALAGGGLKHGHLRARKPA